MTQPPDINKPRAENTAVSLYPEHREQLDALCRYYDASRSRVVQFLIGREHAAIAKETEKDA